MSNSSKGYYVRTFRAVLDYIHENEIPVKLIYDDNSAEIVYIINYDNYNIVCYDKDKENSFIVLKHSLKKIETEVDLKSVIEEEKLKK